MTKSKSFLAAVCLVGLLACSPTPQATATSDDQQASTPTAAQAQTNPVSEESMQQKVLVAYFSYSGNTAAVARQIANKTGGDNNA